MPKRGWDTVTVPGCGSAWQAVSGRFGKLPFAELSNTAIDCSAWFSGLTDHCRTVAARCGAA
jgi:gamma-glutamyltranspeptidase/glutathione hydrolase